MSTSTIFEKVRTMNKKLLLLFFTMMFSFMLSAQTEHMKFAGIPLTGTIDQFQKKLVAKGYKIDTKMSQMLPVGTRCFVGTFAGKQGNIAVYYDADTKEVYGAKVYYDGMTEDRAEGEYESLRSILSAKYGEDNITDGTDKSNRPTFTVNTGLGIIYCYMMKDETLLSYPYNWSTHAEFNDNINGAAHQSNMSDDF